MTNQIAHIIEIALPGAGSTQTYRLSTDTQIKFGFDLAEAVFTGNAGNLQIVIEGGGTVILENYQSLAEAGELPPFELLDGEQVPGNVYLFAFADTGQNTDAVETAADGATSGSGAGAYSDDPGSLGDGIDALGGQVDAFDSQTFAPLSEVSGDTEPLPLANNAPTAAPDVTTIEEDQTANGNVLDNDADADGDPLQVTGFTIAGDSTSYNAGDTAIIDNIGQLTLNADGSYTFEPVQDFNGNVPTVTYTITDGEATSSTTLNVNVTPINDAPEASADSVTVTEPDGATSSPEAEIATGNVLDNDTDPDNIDNNPNDDPQRLTEVSYTAANGTVTTVDFENNEITVGNGTPSPYTGSFATDYGTLTIDSTGAYTFEATNDALVEGYDPTEEFSYTVADSAGATATSTLSVTVEGLNDAPVASDDTFGSVSEGSTGTQIGGLHLIGNVGDNDTDVDTIDTPDTLTFTMNSPAPAGVTLGTDGSVFFDATDPAYNSLAEGKTQEVSFSYVVNDGNGGTDTATATFTVIGTNDGAAIDVRDGDSDTGSVIEIEWINTDTNVVDDFQASQENNPQLDQFGNLIVEAAPGTLHTEGHVTVTDPDDHSVGTPTDTVNEATLAPTVLYNNVEHGGSFDGSGNFTFTTDNGGTFTLKADGSWSYDIDNTLNVVQQLGNNESFDERITVQSQDGSATHDIMVTVNGTNDAPVITAVGMPAENFTPDEPIFTVNENVTGSIPVAQLASSDVESQDVSYIIDKVVDATGHDVTAEGLFVVDGDRILTADGVAFDHETNSQYVITVSPMDSQGAIGQDVELTVHIGDVNEAPVASDNSIITLEDQTASGNVISDNDGNGIDFDVDGDELHVTQFTVAGDGTVYAAGDTATIDGVGTLTIDENGGYTFTPAADYNGNVPVVTYTIADGPLAAPETLTDTAELTINITPVNDAPTIDLSMGTVTFEGEEAGYNNMLGTYTLVDGIPTNPEIILENANTANVGEILTTFEDGQELHYFLVAVGYGQTPQGEPQFVWNDSTHEWDIQIGNATYDARFDDATLNPHDPEATFAIDDLAAGRAINVDDQLIAGGPQSGDDDDFDDVMVEEHTNPGTSYENTFVEDGGPVRIAGEVNITDIDSTHLSKAVITLNKVEGTDSLAIVDDPLDAISVAISADGSTITLTGIATLEEYESAIEQITFNNTSQDPSSDNRTIDVQVWDQTAPANGAASNVAQAIIHVVPVNDGPDAVDDVQTTDEDTPVTINVLVNDTDPENDPLHIDGTPTADNGTVTVNNDGTLQYTPNQDFNGIDTIHYTISDGHGGTDSAIVTVTVNAVEDNTPPVAVDDSGSGTAVFESDEDGGNAGSSAYTLVAQEFDGNQWIEATVSTKGDNNGTHYGVLSHDDGGGNDWQIENDGVPERLLIQFNDGQYSADLTITSHGGGQGTAQAWDMDGNLITDLDLSLHGNVLTVSSPSTTIGTVILQAVGGSGSVNLKGVDSIPAPIVDDDEYAPVVIEGNVLANDWDAQDADYPDTGPYPDGHTQLTVTGIAAGDLDAQLGSELTQDNDDGSVMQAFDTHIGTDFNATGEMVQGQYGQLEIGADGKYTYTSNEDMAPGNYTETFTYQITDTDGAVDYGKIELSVTVPEPNMPPEAAPDLSHGVLVTDTLYGWSTEWAQHVNFNDTGGANKWSNVAERLGLVVSADNTDGHDASVVQAKPAPGIGVDTKHVENSPEIGENESLTLDFGNHHKAMPLSVKIMLGEISGFGEQVIITAKGSDGSDLVIKNKGAANEFFVDGVQGEANGAGQVLIDSITISAGTGASFTVYALEVTGASEWVVTNPDSGEQIATPVSGFVLDNDHDVDSATMTAAIVGSGVGTWGTVEITDAHTGAYTYTPDTDAIFDDTTGLHGTAVEQFTYQVTDESGASDTATLFIPLHYNANVTDHGTANADVVYGNDGNEVITGLNGNDFLYGEAGQDHIDGGADHDYISGGAGNDTLYGGDGNDLILGDDGDDIIYGGTGNDTIYGGAGNDTIYGGDGDDVIYDGAGDDTIHVSSGHDTVYLGSGADTIALASQHLSDGDGAMTVKGFDLNGGDSLDLGNLSNVSVEFSSGNNGNDLNLVFNDIDGSSDMTIILQGVNPNVNEIPMDSMTIDTNDALNTLIQHIIESGSMTT